MDLKDIFNDNIDIDTEWYYLKNIIENIFTLEININNKLWMDTYTRIYNIYVNNNNDYHFTIYNNINNLIENKIKDIFLKINNIEDYYNSWIKIKKISVIIVNIFRY